MTTAAAGTVCHQVRVRGRVQGVGFRDGCVQQAFALGLAGWVRNRHDGSVELLLQGPAALVQAFRDWLPDGVPAARVEAVSVAAVPAPWPVLQSFERRPTE